MIDTSGDGAKILIADDIPANLNLLSDALEPAGYNILAAPSGEVALRIANRMHPDLILLDIMMPGLDGYETCRLLKGDTTTRDIPVIFLTAKDETQSIVEGFRVGGVDYVTKPFQADEILMRVATHLEIHRLNRQLRQKNEELEAEMAKRKQAEADLEKAGSQLSIISQREADLWGLAGFVGASPGFAAVLQDIRRLQSFSSTSVLIAGESGTGKELIARALHYGGPLAKAPFIPVNCAAVPGELAESTFFGHARGAFTGATSDRKGYFEQAHQGTLFLDEIGDMPLPLQAKLLRVLEDGVIAPVGSTQQRKVGVRVVAGSNVDLQAQIEAGKFREDLYYRLARFTIQVPPLRERKEDIPLLVDHFLAQFAAEMGLIKPRFSAQAMAALLDYPYPGNIRELKNLVERALIESGGGEIGPKHLCFVQLHRAKGTPAGVRNADPKSGSKSVPATRGALSSESEKILAFVREHDAINNTECRELLSVGMQRACYLLRKMHSAGWLRRESHGRWSRYRLP